VRKLLAASALVLGTGIWMFACKQGEGDRCQVNADCASGLVCNQATQSCAKTSGGGIDATVPNPPMPDAAPIDSSIDSPIDSSIDSP
jgi:hypothetical protein